MGGGPAGQVAGEKIYPPISDRFNLPPARLFQQFCRPAVAAAAVHNLRVETPPFLQGHRNNAPLSAKIRRDAAGPTDIFLLKGVTAGGHHRGPAHQPDDPLPFCRRNPVDLGRHHPQLSFLFGNDFFRSRLTAKNHAQQSQMGEGVLDGTGFQVNQAGIASQLRRNFFLQAGVKNQVRLQGRNPVRIRMQKTADDGFAGAVRRQHRMPGNADHFICRPQPHDHFGNCRHQGHHPPRRRANFYLPAGRINKTNRIGPMGGCPGNQHSNHGRQDSCQSTIFFHLHYSCSTRQKRGDKRHAGIKKIPGPCY